MFDLFDLSNHMLPTEEKMKRSAPEGLSFRMMG